MQRYPWGINTDRGHIFHKCHADRKACPILFKPGHPVYALQTLYNGFFHNGLDIRRAKELTLHRIGLGNPEFPILGNIIFPWQGFCLFKKLVKSFCLYFCYFQQDSFCGTQKDIGICDSLCICLECYFSILYFGNLIAQIKDLTFQHSFHTEMTWSDQFKFFHSLSFLYVDGTSL